MIFRVKILAIAPFIQSVLSTSKKLLALASMPSQLMAAIQLPSPMAAPRFMKASTEAGKHSLLQRSMVSTPCCGKTLQPIVSTPGISTAIGTTSAVRTGSIRTPLMPLPLKPTSTSISTAMERLAVLTARCMRLILLPSRNLPVVASMPSQSTVAVQSRLPMVVHRFMKGSMQAGKPSLLQRSMVSTPCCGKTPQPTVCTHGLSTATGIM